MVFRKALFYVLLAAATVGLSEFLAAWRAWRAAPGMAHAAQVAVLGVGLVGVGLWLGFLLYEVDRAAGRVRRPIRLYEWVLARRDPQRQSKPSPARPDHRGVAVSEGRGRG
jgi:hypothetical protein